MTRQTLIQPGQKVKVFRTIAGHRYSTTATVLTTTTNGVVTRLGDFAYSEVQTTGIEL